MAKQTSEREALAAANEHDDVWDMEVVQRRGSPGDWVVERTHESSTGEGEIESTLFSGHRAEERAREYAAGYTHPTPQPDPPADVAGLVEELRAKAAQSSNRRNSAGGLSRPEHHVCSRAASAITALQARATTAEAALAQAQEEIGRLRAAVAELSADLQSEIEDRYPPDARRAWPGQARRYDRDMEPVRRAASLLSSEEGVTVPVESRP